MIQKLDLLVTVFTSSNFLLKIFKSQLFDVKVIKCIFICLEKYMSQIKIKLKFRMSHY